MHIIIEIDGIIEDNNTVNKLLLSYYFYEATLILFFNVKFIKPSTSNGIIY